MESASLIAESVKIIKHLKNQVAVLESENEKLKSDLANVQKRYNDLLTKEAQVSPKDGMCFVASPTANNIALADLSQQNAALRKQLSNSSQGDCNDLVEREDFAILVQKYQTELAQKDKEIAFLKQNTQEKDLKEKVVCLDGMLHRARAANQVFAEEIESLQREVESLKQGTSFPETGPTEVHAPSADDVMNGSGMTSTAVNSSPCQPCQDMVPMQELESAKMLNLDLQQRLNEAVNARERVMVELEEKGDIIHSLEGKLKQLHNENVALTAQINSQKDSSNEVIETQLKAFMEDFNMERQEKEQIAQQKRQMHDENNKLRVQLAALMDTLKYPNEEPHHEPPYGRTPLVAPASYHHQYIQQRGPPYDPTQAYPYHSQHPPAPTSPPHCSRQLSNSQYTPATSRPAPMMSSPPAQHQPQQPRRIGFARTNAPEPAMSPLPTTAPARYTNDPSGPDFNVAAAAPLNRMISHPGTMPQHRPGRHLHSDNAADPPTVPNVTRSNNGPDAPHP